MDDLESQDPSVSTFWIKLKGEDIKVTKKEVDEFISSRVEQQQTTMKAEKKRKSGKIVTLLQDHELPGSD
jgi:hypothetical protein